MRFQFRSLGPSGNGVDFILAVERQPSAWDRLFGAGSAVEEFFGPHPQWVTMQGLAVEPAMQRRLDGFWRSQLQGRDGCRAGDVGPWTGLEPAPESGESARVRPMPAA